MNKYNISAKSINVSDGKIGLRGINLTDFSDFYELVSLNDAIAIALDNIKETLNIFIDGDEILAITYNGKFVGTIGMHNTAIKTNKRALEVGYTISKKYYNLGIASTAVALLKKELFEKYNIEELYICFNENNIASRRVAEKNSFRFYESHIETLLREPFTELVYYINKNIYAKYSNEHLVLYDANTLERLNKFARRIDIVGKEYYFGVVEVILYNTKYKKFLLTRRAKEKTFAGQYEISGGAMNYNELEEEGALRELYEETGIKPYKINFINKMIFKRSLFFQYIAYTDKELDAVLLQDGETDAYKWVTYQELLLHFEGPLCIQSQKNRLYKIIKELNYE